MTSRKRRPFLNAWPALALLPLVLSGCASSMLVRDLTEVTGTQQSHRRLDPMRDVVGESDFLILRRVVDGMPRPTGTEMFFEKAGGTTKLFSSRPELRLPIRLLKDADELVVTWTDATSNQTSIRLTIQPGKTRWSDLETTLESALPGLDATLEPRAPVRVLPGDRVTLCRIGMVFGESDQDEDQGPQIQPAETHNLRVDALGRLPVPALTWASLVGNEGRFLRTEPVLRQTFSSLERHAFDVRLFFPGRCRNDQPTLDQVEDCLAAVWKPEDAISPGLEEMQVHQVPAQAICPYQVPAEPQRSFF